MANAENHGGGFKGFFIRIWCEIVATLLGVKWCFIETFTKHRKLDWSNVQDRRGETVVLTGGTRGVGYELLKVFLTAEMNVIVGCRSTSAGDAAVNKIRNEGATKGKVTILELDLMSLDSVRVFAEEVLRQTNAVHVLVNNAGIMACPFLLSPDGFESQFQTNYLGHFLLTETLYPALVIAGQKNKSSRIVHVSSIAHFGGSINFEDINGEALYAPFRSYMQSKLMQVVSTMEMSARMKANKHPVRVYTVHPGMVLTDLYQHVPLVNIFRFIFKYFYKSTAQGADGVAYAALSKDIETEDGIFLANCQKYEPNPKSRDRGLQRNLLETSCGLTGIEIPGVRKTILKRVISKHDIEAPFVPNKNDQDVVVDMDNA